MTTPTAEREFEEIGGPDLPTPGPVTTVEDCLARAQGGVLPGCTVTDISLAEADLHESDLSNVRWERVDLRGANLAGADLSRGTFRGVQLDGADLTGATLDEADFGLDAEGNANSLLGATLTEASLWRAFFERAVLSRCDLREATLDEATFLSCALVHA
jgi:uncharacterized protein YjbI with pentapeptide repeats